VVLGEARITPALTGHPFDVRELHVWRVHEGRLRGLEVFVNAPAALLGALDGQLETKTSTHPSSRNLQEEST